ncbi:MAG: DUF4173 domain-containing protein [Lachnospiraceae bacterium]|nr:DUF4173 domain-containing protein [Lachnospiraceae bacterium]
MDENQNVSGTQALSSGPATNPAEGANLTVINGAKLMNRETEETKKLKENYTFFGPITALYAVFYALCMYKNGSGITFPFFVAGSLCYFYFAMKKLELTWKKGSAFYVVSMMLLAISTFCTADLRIIALNKTGIFLLMMCFLISQFFKTEEWGFLKFASTIPTVLLTAIGELPRPIEDMKGFAKKKESAGTRKGVYVFLGILITIPLFAIVMALLSSADILFRQVTEKMIVDIDFADGFGILLSILFWYFGIYMLVAFLCKKSVKEEVTDHRKGEPILAITVTGLLSVMYVYFSGIQIFGLFLGKMQLPHGYTYAQYAREGFFQLLAVAILNLLIVLFCLAVFRESKVLKAILVIMSLCTFVMIASSAMRMILYVQSYNLTYLRIIVLWALAVLALLFLGVCLQIFNEKFPLFRYGMTLVTLCYIVLAFSHPDYIIAKYNLENINGPLDYRYLSELSADAAPVLVPFLKEQGYELEVVKEESYWDTVHKACGHKDIHRFKSDGFGYYYLESIHTAYQNMTIRNFNLSRYLAVQAATK